MKDNRSTAPRFVALVLLLALPPAMYVAAYFLRSEKFDFSIESGPVKVVRQYPTELEAVLFRPAVGLESWITDEHIVSDHLCYPGSEGMNNVGLNLP